MACGYRVSFIAAGYRLSSIGHRLSVIDYRLSAIGYRLSAIGYRLSAIGYRLSDTLQRQRCLGFQVPLRADARAQAPHRGRADHRGVIGRERQRRDEHGQPGLRTARLRVRSQAAVCRDAARNPETLRIQPRRRFERPIEQCLHDRALKARRDVSDDTRIEIRRRRTKLRDHPRHGGLQATETEIEAAFDGWWQ